MTQRKLFAMSYFGKIDALDSRKYTFDMPPNSVPLELIVQAEGSDREFVLLPEQSQIANFSKKCETYFSQGLDAKYQYVGGGISTLVIGMEEDRIGVKGKLEFVIARWARKSETPFPRQIRITIKDLSLDANLNFVEVISASAQHNPGGK